MQDQLGARGLFLEPSAAAGFAALERLAECLPGADPERETVVVIATAGGLRQVGLLAERLDKAPVLAPEPAALEEFLAQPVGPRR